MKTISTLIACLTGAFFWLFTFILFKDGAGPIGGADFLTWVLFFAPLVFFGPLMVRLSDQNKGHIALWLFALFPSLSILANALVMLITFVIVTLFSVIKPVPYLLNSGSTLIVITLAFWSVFAIGSIAIRWASKEE
jgi:hypothetical protein